MGTPCLRCCIRTLSLFCRTSICTLQLLDWRCSNAMSMVLVHELSADEKCGQSLAAPTHQLPRSKSDEPDFGSVDMLMLICWLVYRMGVNLNFSDFRSVNSCAGTLDTGLASAYQHVKMDADGASHVVCATNMNDALGNCMSKQASWRTQTKTNFALNICMITVEVEP